MDKKVTNMAYNKIILQGNLSKDIEVRYTQSGTAMGSTSIAVSKKYKTQSGEQKEETLFIDLKAFGRIAEIMNQYMRKGSKVLVDGSLKFEQWTSHDGTKRSKHVVIVENIQMLDTKQKETQQEQSGYAQPADNTPPQVDINNDELPF